MSGERATLDPRIHDSGRQTCTEGECAFPEIHRRLGTKRDRGPVRDPILRANGDATERNRLPPQEETPLAPGAGSSSGSVPTPAVEEKGDQEGQNRERRNRKSMVDAMTQEGGGAQADQIDAGRAIEQLSSTDEAQRRLNLKRLHTRWYHANTQRMQQLLRAAGVPANIIAEVPSVVQSCSVCRDWQKPPPHSVTSVHLAEGFNDEVQMDLWEVHSQCDDPGRKRRVVHLIDVATRFAANMETPSKEEEDLIRIVSIMWISIHVEPGSRPVEPQIGQVLMASP